MGLPKFKQLVNKEVAIELGQSGIESKLLLLSISG